jgi:hypothetical protein
MSSKMAMWFPKKSLFRLGFGILVLGPSLAAQSPSKAVPSLDELAGQWQNASSLRSLPALSSGHGSAQAARGVLSLENVSFPPITMAGDTGALLIEGQMPKLEQTRWFPYQVVRRGRAGDIAVETAVRMPYAESGFLFHIVLTNNSAVRRNLQVTIVLSANIARHKPWNWDIPRNQSASRFIGLAADNGLSAILRDTEDGLVNCFSFEQKPASLSFRDGSGEARWHISLDGHSSSTIDYVLSLGESEARVHDLAKDWASDFGSVFGKVKSDWQSRFDAMFTPNNKYFSGNLPILDTADIDLRRVYYTSATSILSVLRTSFPIAPRVYVSNSPVYNGIDVYFWDTREWATALALLDPEMMKCYLRDWLSKGIYGGYAEEFLSGNEVGPVYSANDLSVFVQLNTYVSVTGDRAFLTEKIGGKTVLEHMDAIATHWKSLVRPGQTLADYGEAENLLECVPTYIHEVPSFNAANVWMMRRTAALQEAERNTKRAEELRADADRLLRAVLALYEPGHGVWDSLHRDGSRVEMRHVFDYSTVGLTITDDLTSDMRKEMTEFVERELLTDHWMRAQSLSDPAAKASDRPDHGPMGAFSAWPAETMATMCEFGQFDKALNFMHRIASVTEEGPFSQSRELLGTTRDAQVRIALRGDQDYFVSSGASFAETIIRNFFGYQPDVLGGRVISNSVSRGFEGRLLNVLHGKKLLEIDSTARGIEVTPAEKDR